MALFGLDFSAVFDAIKGFLGGFGKLFDIVSNGVTHVTNIISSTENLIQSVRDEVDGWKNFKQDIRFKSRAIVLEQAFQKTRDLIEGIPESWNAIVDIFKSIKTKFTETGGSSGEALEETEAAIKDIESGSFKTIFQKFPRLAKGFEKVFGVLALIIDGLEQVANIIDDLQTVIDELKRLRLEIEKLDTIFLSQSNKRRTLRLESGKSIRIRVGHLHA